MSLFHRKSPWERAVESALHFGGKGGKAALGIIGVIVAATAASAAASARRESS
jgi:hypothetical protein